MPYAVKRLFIIVLGYCVGAFAATEAAFLLLGLRDSMSDVAGAGHFPSHLLPVGPLLPVGILAGVAMFIPAVFVVGLGEFLSIKRWYYYSGTGGLAALLMATGRDPLPQLPSASHTILNNIAFVLFVCGAVAGFVYWAISGRKAGGFHD